MGYIKGAEISAYGRKSQKRVKLRRGPTASWDRRNRQRSSLVISSRQRGRAGVNGSPSPRRRRKNDGGKRTQMAIRPDRKLSDGPARMARSRVGIDPGSVVRAAASGYGGRRFLHAAVLERLGGGGDEVARGD
jgi:hypothetical protein